MPPPSRMKASICAERAVRSIDRDICIDPTGSKVGGLPVGVQISSSPEAGVSTYSFQASLTGLASTVHTED